MRETVRRVATFTSLEMEEEEFEVVGVPLLILMLSLTSKQEQNKSLGPIIFPYCPISVKLRDIAVKGFTPTIEKKIILTSDTFILIETKKSLREIIAISFRKQTWSWRRNVMRV